MVHNAQSEASDTAESARMPMGSISGQADPRSLRMLQGFGIHTCVLSAHVFDQRQIDSFGFDGLDARKLISVERVVLSSVRTSASGC